MEEIPKSETYAENPYGLPQDLMGPGIEFEGTTIPKLPLALAEDTISHIKNLMALEVKGDDVFILAFPKCGTHWIWEVTQMLLNQSTQYEKRSKENIMAEIMSSSDLKAEKSPRVINSHLFMCHLPREIVPKRAKIIHLVRNPKDTFVSFYHHMKQRYPKGLDLENFMRAYHDSALMLPHQFDFLDQMSQFEKDHPDHPIMHLYYEDMKKNPNKVVKDLADFLQVSASDQFIEEVVLACGFENMKKADENKNMPDVFKKIMELRNIRSFAMYRKGIIGDWKNNFTVAQNEVFDEFIFREMDKKKLPFKFIYE